MTASRSEICTAAAPEPTPRPLSAVSSRECSSSVAPLGQERRVVEQDGLVTHAVTTVQSFDTLNLSFLSSNWGEHAGPA